MNVGTFFSNRMKLPQGKKLIKIISWFRPPKKNQAKIIQLYPAKKKSLARIVQFHYN
jgi:hypothetical protein